MRPTTEFPRTRTARKMYSRNREESDLILKCAVIQDSLDPETVFSHATALSVYGVYLPKILQEDQFIHVTTPQQTLRPRSGQVIAHHLDKHDQGEPRNVDGLRVIHPVWAWLQECYRLSDVQAIEVADALIRRIRRPGSATTIRSGVCVSWAMRSSP
jgi:hypothetical protein